MVNETKQMFDGSLSSSNEDETTVQLKCHVRDNHKESNSVAFVSVELKNPDAICV